MLSVEKHGGTCFVHYNHIHCVSSISCILIVSYINPDSKTPRSSTFNYHKSIVILIRESGCLLYHWTMNFGSEKNHHSTISHRSIKYVRKANCDNPTWDWFIHWISSVTRTWLWVLALTRTWATADRTRRNDSRPSTLNYLLHRFGIRHVVLIGDVWARDVSIFPSIFSIHLRIYMTIFSFLEKWIDIHHKTPQTYSG